VPVRAHKSVRRNLRQSRSPIAIEPGLLGFDESERALDRVAKAAMEISALQHREDAP